MNEQRNELRNSGLCLSNIDLGVLCEPAHREAKGKTTSAAMIGQNYQGEKLGFRHETRHQSPVPV
jgi:hypothetical protein